MKINDFDGDDEPEGKVIKENDYDFFSGII